MGRNNVGGNNTRRNKGRKLAGVALAAAVATSAMLVAGSGAGAQMANTEIVVDATKVVVNAPEQETTFTIKLSCTDTEGNADSDTATVRWHKPGASSWKLDPVPVVLSAYDSNWGETDVTCVLSEPGNGGAVTTTISCDSVVNGPGDPADAIGCSGDTLTVPSEELNAVVADFTVTNDFTPTPTTTTTAGATTTTAASAITEAPSFTG